MAISMKVRTPFQNVIACRMEVNFDVSFLPIS